MMRKNKYKGIAGLLIMTLALVVMYVWLMYGQKALASNSVLVASMDIEPGTILDPGTHFVIKNISKDCLVSGFMNQTDLPSLDGLSANQFIPMNAQITGRFFEKSGIVVANDRFIFKIPNSWIYAVPSSIRRGDEILIYEIDSRIDQGVNFSSSVTEDDLETFQAKPTIEISSQKPIIETTVIYVKDSSNREVVDADDRSRLDGTSQVSSIEIVSTREDTIALEKKVAEGKKLILVYR